jgi:outer membrane lipoprotein LolB
MRFELSGSEAAGSLVLASPVGTSLAQARWRDHQIDLATPDGVRRFDSLDALTRELLGEPLPLVAVLDWLRGRPWPGASHRVWADVRSDGSMAGFDQIGWQINLTRFDLQSLMFTRADPPPRIEVRVRLDPPSP